MEDFTEKLIGTALINKVNKSKIDDEELSHKVARVLTNKPEIHKIIVVDEIDCFESHEKAFLTLTKTLLKS